MALNYVQWKVLQFQTQAMAHMSRSGVLYLCFKAIHIAALARLTLTLYEVSLRYLALPNLLIILSQTSQLYHSAIQETGTKSILSRRWCNEALYVASHGD